MTLVLGVDGCKRGWCVAAIDVSTRRVVGGCVYRSFGWLLDSPAAVMGVDIPIGLLDRLGQRACDVEARRLLGRVRASSVFPPPSRRSLAFGDYHSASHVNFDLTGRRLNKQSFNIAPKAREVDEVMKPDLQGRVLEVHPELSFWALNGGIAMARNKKTRDGRVERWRLLRKVFLELDKAPVLPRALRGRCGMDDYIDALVCAWTAVCVERGKASRIPDEPEVDERGLRMEMWLPGDT